MSIRTLAAVVPLCLALALVRCGPLDEDPDLESCDPMATVELPIQLGTIKAVGQGSDGTLYLVDEFDGRERLFVSSGEVLSRRDVRGSGHGSDHGNESWEFSFREDGQDMTLAIEIPTSRVVRMAVGPLPRGSIEEVAAAGEWLEVQDAGVVDGMALENLPGVQIVEYFAEVETGETVLVTRQKYDWSYDDFRLFMGQPDAMVEYRIKEVLRYDDGGTTYFLFDLEGAEARLYFGTLLDDPVENFLEHNGAKLDVTRLDASEFSAAAYSFSCLSGA